MDSERILRTSIFGGFRREDVLSYVEELKGEIAELREELKGKVEKIDTLCEMADNLSRACEEAKETEQKLSEVTAALKAEQQKNETLAAENAELSKRVGAIDSEKAAMEQKAAEIRASEAQLGAAFLDARKYSDEIVSAANQKANETQSEVSDSIAKQATEVAKLSADVDALSATLSKSIESLHADISALSVKLSKAAQSLQNRKDAEKFAPDISMKIERELGEKIAGVTETDDGSGLTYIHYPPHTEFNEDLNITPNTVFRFDTPKEG